MTVVLSDNTLRARDDSVRVELGGPVRAELGPADTDTARVDVFRPLHVDEPASER